MNPEDLRYTEQHEWVRIDGNRITVGITHYAQEALGDVVYVDLPSAGTTVDADQPFGEVESTKSVSDLFAPVAGSVVERNTALESNPELVNADPYGDGWMVVLEVQDPSTLDGLLTAEAYGELTEDA